MTASVHTRPGQCAHPARLMLVQTALCILSPVKSQQCTNTTQKLCSFQVWVHRGSVLTDMQWA